MRPVHRHLARRSISARLAPALALALATLASCAAPTDRPAPSSTPSPTPDASTAAPTNVASQPVVEPLPAPAPPLWAALPTLRSNGGDYVVHFEPGPGEIPDNEAFALRVWVAHAGAPNELASDVRLAVDAAMPEHGHGMNRTPRITRDDDGAFVVEGMLFHMTGRWELYFDITSGALTERAQTDVVLE